MILNSRLNNFINLFHQYEPISIFRTIINSISPFMKDLSIHYPLILSYPVSHALCPSLLTSLISSTTLPSSSPQKMLRTILCTECNKSTPNKPSPSPTITMELPRQSNLSHIAMLNSTICRKLCISTTTVSASCVLSWTSKTLRISEDTMPSGKMLWNKPGKIRAINHLSSMLSLLHCSSSSFSISRYDKSLSGCKIARKCIVLRLLAQKCSSLKPWLSELS